MWINSSALSEWVSEWHSATFSDSSLCAVGSRIMNESQRERESRPHSSLCAGEWVPASTLVGLFAEDSRVRCSSSTPGRHARSWAQLNWERNKSVHEVIPFSSFTQKICLFKWHVRDWHNTISYFIVLLTCCGFFLVTNVLIVSHFGQRHLLNTINVIVTMRWAVVLRVHEYLIMYRPAKDNGNSGIVELG